MKLTKIKPSWLFMLILVFHTIPVQAEDFHDDEVRVLIVGIRGQSRFSAADLLSGRKDGGQEDREIVKTPVITDEGRRMMLVTGPNLCEEDTARQTFTTALSLLSPGPHAVLIVLNLEDQQSQQCDIVKRTQELLGAEVLQYCIVLLHQNHQEHFTGASREMINTCGGRFHVMGDSEPKPAQTAALVAEIDKLVQFRGKRCYSSLTQELETEKTVHKENLLLPVLYDTLGGAFGIKGWILLLLLNAALMFARGRHKVFNFGKILFALVCLTFALRNILNPNVAVPLNLILSSTFVIAIAYNDLSESRRLHRIIVSLNMIFAFPIVVFIAGLGLILGTVLSIRTWSDVLIACHAAPGITFFGYLCTVYSVVPNQIQTIAFAFKLFLSCSVGATLSVGFVIVTALFDGKMAIMILILICTSVYFYLKSDSVTVVVFFLIFPCCCVFIGSFILLLHSISLILYVLFTQFLIHFLQ
ncbi:uncharacterized protein LOC127156668 isoform X2 [Labeo rohita]|nr:uncharacterized protein LOC127156668 isoform X2 [Labeo rohita]